MNFSRSELSVLILVSEFEGSLYGFPLKDSHSRTNGGHLLLEEGVRLSQWILLLSRNEAGHNA